MKRNETKKAIKTVVIGGVSIVALLGLMGASVSLVNSVSSGHLQTVDAKEIKQKVSFKDQQEIEGFTIRTYESVKPTENDISPQSALTIGLESLEADFNVKLKNRVFIVFIPPLFKNSNPYWNITIELAEGSTMFNVDSRAGKLTSASVNSDPSLDWSWFDNWNEEVVESDDDDLILGSEEAPVLYSSEERVEQEQRIAGWNKLPEQEDIKQMALDYGKKITGDLELTIDKTQIVDIVYVAVGSEWDQSNEYRYEEGEKKKSIEEVGLPFEAHYVVEVGLSDNTFFSVAIDKAEGKLLSYEYFDVNYLDRNYE
ncbi:hypothetical protein I6N95_07715 [Vagococcus sp. BWB3-3]|uniref:Uncharacterized protein n=1 Tax=Vagococcus allomyrinae TaxID=2794353 RepID=A0A940SUK1_9ENTE|nr:hypothetical protein [Vagococcus allomyrinae]MBP1040889.1 hypothetical protein [Vagococcus allomyrinae]